MEMIFRDRQEAGRLVAKELAPYAQRPDTVVVGLARGGVVVAYEVAKALNLPLDVLVVRKLGAPGQPELAMGATAAGGGYTVNEDVVGALHVKREEFDAVLQRELKELNRREHLYRQGRPCLDIQGRTVIIADDGLATGATMRTAISALRHGRPYALVMAVPVASPEAHHALRGSVEEVVCLGMPDLPLGISASYVDFSQTTDEKVCELLQSARMSLPGKVA